ncbi:MAG: Fibronectin type-III protein, partial [Euryarchaeota archaeon]|nr:Fibronectin type-III protein [Euryarchaeota archaeon]
MRKLPKIIVLLLLVAAVIFAAGCAQKKVTPVNETITPVNKTVTPVNETVAPVNESVVQANVSAGTNRTVTVNDGKKTHSRNHNTPTTTENNTTENNTTENNTTEDNVTTTTQIVNLSVHGHSTKIVSLKVTPENPTVSLGQTQQFTAIGTFSDSSIKDITDKAILSSSNTTVASISDSGLATSKSIGITQINATYDGISSTDQTLTVTEVKLVSIGIFPAKPTVHLGQTQKFTAFGIYSDGIMKDITANATWLSSNNTVANISASGLASSISLGTTQINATCDGISSPDQRLKVIDAKLEFVTVTPQNPNITLNRTRQFIANGTYSDGSTKDITALVIWSSSNTTVANISASGLATPSSTGITQINATNSDIECLYPQLSILSQTLTVTDAELISIAITPLDPIVTLNQTQQFIANGTYSDGSIIDVTAIVNWSSSNTTVANISVSGLAMAVSQGTTQINATIGEISSPDQTLTVPEPQPQHNNTNVRLISIEISPVNSTVVLGQTQQFSANGTYSDGSKKDITANATWSSSNTTVANINASGLATPSSVGTTQINATINGISSPDQTLTVPEPQPNNTNVIRLISIEISPVNPIVALNETQQFSANGTYSDGSIKDITANATWSSSNTTVASINTSGLTTSTSIGITQINATSEGVSSNDQTLTITKAKPVYTVNDTKLVSITVTPLNPTVSLGQTQQFIANGNYSDGSTKDITDTVIWLSSNTMVAGINASGLATSTFLGTTQINATREGISSNDQTLTVTDAKLVSITIIPLNP